MTQTYRTDDLGRWGAGKGSNLEPEEFDINFWDIIQRLITQEARPDPSASIDHFSVSGASFYVHMTDATVLGPYALPVATFFARGEWAPSTAYSVLDTFTINGGLYVVIFAHTSALTFDAGANDGMGHDYYVLMIQTPGSAMPVGGAVGQVVEKSTTSDFAVTWGWKLPTGGTARQYLIKQSSTNQDAIFDTPTASDIEFVPVTGSVLTADNVADAIEEAATNAGDAADVTYTPSTGSGLTDDNVADALDTLGARGVPFGKQTMWIPASAMIPRTTNGAASNTFETTTHKNMVRTNDFDSSTQEFVQFDVAMPKSWDGDDISFKVFWSHSATTVNFGVAFGLEAVGVGDTTTLDVAFGTTVYVTDTGGVTDYLYVSAESDPITISGTVTYGSEIMFQLCRYPANAGDTLAVDARLHGVQVYYTTNTAADS